MNYTYHPYVGRASPVPAVAGGGDGQLPHGARGGRLHVEHACRQGERRDDHLERVAGAEPAVQLEQAVQHLRSPSRSGVLSVSTSGSALLYALRLTKPAT